MANEKIPVGFPIPHLAVTDRGIRISNSWLRLECEANRRSPQLGKRVKGMRERAAEQRVDLQQWDTERPLSTRINETTAQGRAMARWRKDGNWQTSGFPNFNAWGEISEDQANAGIQRSQ